MPDDIDLPTPTPTTQPASIWMDRDKDQPSTEALVDAVCSHLASGGDLIELGELWQVPMGRISAWMRRDPARSAQLNNAYVDQSAWYTQRIKLEMRRIALVDIRQAFDEEGRLKPLSEWPIELASAVSSLETEELYEKDDDGLLKGKMVEYGQARKIKLESKLGALKALGLEFGMGKKTLTVDGKITLEDLLQQTLKKESKDA